MVSIGPGCTLSSVRDNSRTSIDLSTPATADGIINRVCINVPAFTGQLAGAVVKIFRDDGTYYLCIDSRDIILYSGQNVYDLSEPLEVKTGDLIGIFTPSAGSPLYDSLFHGEVDGGGVSRPGNIHTNTLKSEWESSAYTPSIIGYYVEPAPTIDSISWSPTGDHITLAPGTALVEYLPDEPDVTTQLMLVATNPANVIDPPLSDGEAILQIDQEDPFIVAEGDHFRFNSKEWWALNIICGPECDWITIADEVAEAEKIPKIGDTIQFAATIDWHDQEMSTIKWYYAKAPNECFTDIWDLDWEEFAVGEDTNMPSHTFDTEGDEEITFFMVTATNVDFATGTLDTLCGPIFNLWKLKPSWWDQLLESIRTINSNIATPITDLFPPTEIEGWTSPPFKCPICEEVFEESDSKLEYAKHLMSHITAFEQGWFGK